MTEEGNGGGERPPPSNGGPLVMPLREEILQARRLHASDEIEIERDALVSHADSGFWVQAWVWVPDDDWEGDN